MELTHEDVQRILKIIDEAKHLEEFDLVYGDFQLHIRRQGAGTSPAAAAAPAPVPGAKPAAAPVAAAAPQTVRSPVPDHMTAVRAPMLGTFYRAPAPGEKPFVEVGQSVRSEDTVCLIEVMKLFNAVRAGTGGKVVEIRAGDGELVEYNEVLIVIDPAGK